MTNVALGSHDSTPGACEFLLGYGRGGCGVTQSFDHAVPVSAVREMLAWNAVEVPTFADFMGERVEIPGRKALLRIPGGQVLGTPSTKYGVHQYTQSLLGGVQKILGTDDGGLAISAAGMTGYGAKAWIAVSLADTVCTPEGVEFLPYLAAMGSHDSTIATQYKRTALTLICNNQMSRLHRDNGAGVVKVRHTSNSGLRVESAQEALQILAETEDEFSAQIRLLCQEEVTRAQWDEFVTVYVPLTNDATPRSRAIAENKREGLQAMYLNDPRAATWAGTSFGVLQACNTFDRWMGNGARDEAHRTERNAERDMTDYWQNFDQHAYGVLQAVCA